MNAEKLLKKICAVEPGRYRPTVSEFFVVLDANNDKPVDAAFDAFRGGFLKGQRAAKAEAKKATVGYSAEYTALLRLLERHKNDDRMIGLIYAFAQGLHGKPSTSGEGAK